MRKITNWTHGQIEEFNNLKKRGYSAIGVIDMVADNAENSPELNQKYAELDMDKDNEFAQEIIDLLTGRAEFYECKYLFKLRGITGVYDWPLYLTRVDNKNVLKCWALPENDLSNNSDTLYTISDAKQVLSSTTLTFSDFDIFEEHKDD